MVFMFWWNDSLSSWHFPVCIPLTIFFWKSIGINTCTRAFLFLKFPGYNFSHIFFFQPTYVHLSYTFGDWENWHCVIHVPTESWPGPRLHLGSYSYVLTPIGVMMMLPVCINITLSFPQEPYHHLQRYPYSRKGGCLDLCRTTRSCQMWTCLPLQPDVATHPWDTVLQPHWLQP